MKAMVITMTCGEGHNTIARSLVGEFNKKGIESCMVETYGFDLRRVAFENHRFLWAVRHVPQIYNKIWNYMRIRDYSTDKIPRYVKKCLPYFIQKIDEFKPDIIVCTHSYASAVISYMKKAHLLNENIVTGTILHDFCLSPYWEQSNKLDYIFQPYYNTTEDLIKKGYSEKQIVTLGLPIRSEFYDNFDKLELRKKLNLPDKFTVLSVGGGNSIGNTLKLLKNILKKNLYINIIIINGKNIKNRQKIEKYLQKHKIDNVFNLGFVANIHEYMKASDVIITRCGSNSITECLVLNKPFITRENMIINEAIVRDMFVKNNCAIAMKKITDAGEKIEYLKNNPLIYEKMQNNIKKYVLNNSSKNVVEFLIKKAEN